MKILHLATDDKFLDHALPVFEAVYPNSNEVIVISGSSELRYVKSKVDKVIKPTNWYNFNSSSRNRTLFIGGDIVVCHSLSDYSYRMFSFIPKETPVIWLGWGFDYYSLLDDLSLLLPKTQAMKSALQPVTISMKLRKRTKKILTTLGLMKSMRDAIKRVAIFAPVLPNEYEMVKAAVHMKSFPQYARWNYGTIEDNLIKGFENESVDGNDILVGNSASFTCNHIESFEFLSQIPLENRQIISPLSYGDAAYRREIAKVGRGYFEDNFVPLVDFMPADDYIARIKSCGYVIMNHVRQQALGNIVIMLYLGARVFLREENPVYPFMVEHGVILSTIQELEKNPILISTKLSQSEQHINKTFVSQYWGREQALTNTMNLISSVVNEKM